MKTLLTIISVAFMMSITKGQTESLNKFDSDGKKDGNWTVYYNAKGKEVSDSARAIYTRYTWYEHGKDIYPFDLCRRKDKIIFSQGNEQSDGLKLLNGEYKIVDKNGNVKSIHVFNKGEYFSYRNFYSSGQLHEYCNFTNRFFEEPHTYCKRVYSKTGAVKYYYMRDQPNDEDINDEVPSRFERSYSDSTSITNKRVIGDTIFVTATTYIGNQPRQQADQFFINEGGGERPILHGGIISWYTNGQKKEEGQYDHNKKVGEWKQWEKDGSEILAHPDINQLNRINEEGEKTGWWIVYLDDNLKQLEDSVGATHCMYNYFTGKFYHYSLGIGGLGSKKTPLQFPAGDTLKLGNFNLLSGDYVTNYQSGNVQSVLSAENGIATEYKEYYPDGQLHLHFIYSAACGAPIHMCLKEYDKSGMLKYDGRNWVPQDYLKKYRNA